MGTVPASGNQRLGSMEDHLAVTYLGDGEVSIVQRNCFDLDQDIMVGDLGHRGIVDQLEAVETVLVDARNSPSFGRGRRRHDEVELKRAR